MDRTPLQDRAIWTAKIFAQAVAVAFASALLPAGALVSQTMTSRPEPPGKMVSVNGHRLHLDCKGKVHGATIVLEAGAGDFSFDWSVIQPQLAALTRTCSYDRAGYAWSESGPFPRTLRQSALELHRLLESANIREPYILVGHSLGGLIVRTYFAEYPQQVAGIVLVDASHESSEIMLNGKVRLLRELSTGRVVPQPRMTDSRDSIIAVQE